MTRGSNPKRPCLSCSEDMVPYPNHHSASETEEVPKSHECREVPQKNCYKERKLQVLTGDQLSITICTWSCNTQLCVPAPTGGHGAPRGWLVSGLTLTSPHCVSCQVTHGCVLCGHRAQLQGELVLGCVSADGGVTLDGGAVISVTIIIHASHLL